jgi:hypothetical protein
MKSVRGIALLLGFAFANLLAGCGSNGQGAYQQPVVTMGAAPPTVQPGATAMLSASVTNDSSNNGINWIVTCPAAPCGTVSPTNTASGASTTYTAPAVPPAGDLTVTITASAAAGGSIPASANFKVPGITVSVLPPSATPLQVNATSQITANVTGDAASKGVTWTVTCAVAACGSVAPATTASGAATTYTAPAVPPAGNMMVTIAAASVTNPAATNSTTVTIIGITVSIALPSPVDSAGTEPLTAAVNNDPSNGGVTWSLQITRVLCGRRGCHMVTFPCPLVCGSFSPASTASGAPTTYTAPGAPPNGSVAAVATSVTNTGARAAASVAIRAISVSVTPNPATATVVLKAALALTATLTHDGANGGAGAGVTWTLTQNSVACSPGCGTISPASTLSGASTTYTAPATVPAYPVVTITAISVTDSTKSASVQVTITTASGAACGAGSSMESLLNGQYAFQLQTPGPSIRILAGSFTADGTGKITGGISENGGILQQIDTTRSFYWVGLDHRGCMTLGGASYYRFALGSINNNNVATTGHIIEFDDATGAGSRMAGTLKLQDPNSFAARKFKGTYVIGLAGLDLVGGRSAIAGTFTSDGISTITASNLDIDDAGIITSNFASAPGGSFTCCDTNGRGTLQLTTPTSLAGGLFFYMVSSSEAFIVSSSPTYSGEAIAVPTGTMFTQTSLNGPAVIRKTAQTSTGPLVDIALATANGTSGITIKDNINNAGVFTQSTTPPLTYTVTPTNGRVTLTGGTNPPVLYLYTQNAGFLVGTDANVESGIIEPQVGGPFSNTPLSGAFTLGTANASNVSTTAATLESGIVTPDVAGNVAGTSDQSSSTGLAQNQNVILTYTVALDGTGTFGTGTTAILISGNKLAFIYNTSPAPTITVVEK